jgi:hypothetical protein
MQVSGLGLRCCLGHIQRSRSLSESILFTLQEKYRLRIHRDHVTRKISSIDDAVPKYPHYLMSLPFTIVPKASPNSAMTIFVTSAPLAPGISRSPTASSAMITSYPRRAASLRLISKRIVNKKERALTVQSSRRKRVPSPKVSY